MAARGKHRRLFVLTGLLLLYALACLLSRGFAHFMLSRLSGPAMRALHRLTVPISFPLAEPLAFAAGVAIILALAAAGLRALSRRNAAPLRHWLRGALWAALCIGGSLLALWLPAMVAPMEAPPAPNASQLEWLCGQLIDALNAAELSFPEAAESLRRAPEAAKLPDAIVKGARYPEWMRAASISGLFVPLTGEALVDVTAPAPLIPFTAVHELMHLTGIADEGAANIAAWERCLSAGGAFADSARLWALRYAMGMLLRADDDAWQRAHEKMKDPLSQVFQLSGNAAIPADRRAPGLPSLSLRRGDYTALIGHLIAQGFT
ncbi:MAG: DUF3810 family protein [Clostridia bacterium]|nr:DUF3810 family protein [Clostridia bacterium]